MDNQNKITGIVEQIIDKSGTSKKDGKPFTLKQILIREISGNYPQSAIFEVFGDKSDGIQVSDIVDCFFNLSARKYNRYLGFKEYERQMYDKTGEYLNKYFGQ